METSEARRVRAAGLRATRPRLAVLAVLDQAGTRREHLVVSDIVARTRARAGAVSTQAVYDILEALDRAGLVRRVGSAGAPARFESHVGDHHHLACRRCDALIDVDLRPGGDDVPLATPCPEPADDHGFLLDRAEVTFWGLCPACASPDQGALSREPPPERTHR
jgi:Fur family ferric uptake transcriptional regulator